MLFPFVVDLVAYHGIAQRQRIAFGARVHPRAVEDGQRSRGAATRDSWHENCRSQTSVFSAYGAHQPCLAHLGWTDMQHSCVSAERLLNGPAACTCVNLGIPLLCCCCCMYTCVNSNVWAAYMYNIMPFYPLNEYIHQPIRWSADVDDEERPASSTHTTSTLLWR